MRLREGLPKQFPNWYPEIDGTRKYGHAQLCLTNEEMIRELKTPRTTAATTNP